MYLLFIYSNTFVFILWTLTMDFRFFAGCPNVPCVQSPFNREQNASKLKI